MMNELQLRIIEQATPMFLHYGIKAVTMDMIAARLGMSKRTLYENFKETHKHAILDLLREGIGEGVIRDDINLEIVSTLLSLQFELLKNSDQIFKSKYTFTEIFETIFKSFIRGIATPEGVRYTDEFFAGRENK